MSEKYNEIMAKIELTEDMRERILNQIEANTSMGKSRVVSLNKWNKYLYIAASLVIVTVGAFATGLINTDRDKPDRGYVSIVNGIEECISAKELSEKIGFEVEEIQSLPYKAKQTGYYLYFGTLAEIQYVGENQKIIFRKSHEEGDISGDYNEYSNTDTLKINDCNVTIKGEIDKYKLAIWNYDGYSYSLSFENGVDSNSIKSMVEELSN